jgi:hypothetical protein
MFDGALFGYQRDEPFTIVALMKMEDRVEDETNAKLDNQKAEIINDYEKALDPSVKKDLKRMIGWNKSESNRAFAINCEKRASYLKSGKIFDQLMSGKTWAEFRHL